MYDLIIKNGKIIDGTGSPYFRADIAVKDGKIAKIARHLDGAKEIIDASGLTVTPGFIDAHSHSDKTIITFPEQREKAEQGITTSVGGQCGTSIAPCSRDTEDKGIYENMGTFIQSAKDNPQGSNTALLIGHGSVRNAVMGTENREPTTEELEKMKQHLRIAMENGAVGMSFGLIYNPGMFAKTDELCELAKVLAEYDGILEAHIRNESNELIRAVSEFITVVKASGVRGIISHHKSCFFENWGKVSHTLRMIDEANEEGFDLYCNVYPYTASHTSLASYIVPKEYHADNGVCRNLRAPDTYKKIKEADLKKRGGDDLSWILVVLCKNHPEVLGKRISEIAEMWGMSHHDAAYKLLIDSENTCNCCFFSMCEEDVETVMKHPRAMIGTDSAVARNATVFHPRLKATFPRVLGEYVRNRKVTTLHEMIRKMTLMPAAVYNLTGKGLLREGMDADICIFDADRIIDKATYQNCNERCEGLSFVIIDGKVAVKDAVFNGTMAGKIFLK
ncbi:MAG: D-aminoacylase [Clostridia bacterium]|nr:D-aminoacylase [Clostridia bacterium]